MILTIRARILPLSFGLRDRRQQRRQTKFEEIGLKRVREVREMRACLSVEVGAAVRVSEKIVCTSMYYYSDSRY